MLCENSTKFRFPWLNKGLLERDTWIYWNTAFRCFPAIRHFSSCSRDNMVWQSLKHLHSGSFQKMCDICWTLSTSCTIMLWGMQILAYAFHTRGPFLELSRGLREVLVFLLSGDIHEAVSLSRSWTAQSSAGHMGQIRSICESYTHYLPGFVPGAAWWLSRSFIKHAFPHHPLPASFSW